MTTSTHEKELFDEHRRLVDEALRSERISIDELLKQSSDLTSRVFSSIDEDQRDQSIGSVLARLTVDEKVLVVEALEIEQIGIDEMMKRGLLSLAKTYLSSAANKKKRGFEELSYKALSELSTKSTIRGLAEAKISKVFEAIRQFNRDQVDEEKRIFVSQDSIYKITNCNLDSIKKWIREHQVDIGEANYGIVPKRGTTRDELRELLSEYLDR